jgi:hypothetical protein
MRKVTIANLPLYMDLNVEDLMSLVTKFLIDNFLNDPVNQRPVMDCQINQAANEAILEISSVEEANRLVKVEYIKIFNHNCKISKMGDNLYGAPVVPANITTSAHTAA